MPARQTIIGIDLGGTKIAIGVYDKDTWEELHHEQHATNAMRGFDAVLTSAAKLVAAIRREDTIGVGLGVPGLLRQPEGFLLVAPHIPGSEDVPLRVRFSQAIGLPLEVENDARCFALAEAILGAGKGRKIVVGVTMGTGVGGGVIVDGRLLRGEHGFAGELGHMLLRPGEPPYPGADARGEAEQFFSGTAMGRRCKAAQKPEEYLAGATCSFLHPLVFRELSWMITNLTYVLDPSIIVFGGSTGLALAPHLQQIQDELRRWLLPRTPMPDLTTALTKHPGTLGAALLCR